MEIYLYQCRRLTDEEIIKYKGEEKEYLEISLDMKCFSVEEVNNNKVLYCDLFPFLRKMEICEKNVNVQKIQKDFQIVSTAIFNGMNVGGDSTTVFFKEEINGAKIATQITIPNKDFEEKYEITTIQECYVVYMEYVAYWRNSYLLRGKLCNIGKQYILDKKYCRLSLESKQIISSSFANNYLIGLLYRSMNYPKDDEDLFYFEIED